MIAECTWDALRDWAIAHPKRYTIWQEPVWFVTNHEHHVGVRMSIAEAGYYWQTRIGDTCGTRLAYIEIWPDAIRIGRFDDCEVAPLLDIASAGTPVGEDAVAAMARLL